MKKVKFNKITTVDFLDHTDPERESHTSEKSFDRNQVVEVVETETFGNYVNLIFENGDAALDVPKQNLTFL